MSISRDSNDWEKLGLILSPNKDIWWMSHYCGPTYVDVQSNQISVYVVGRDIAGISRIGIVCLDRFNPQRVLSISPDPVLDVGDVGCFDESGVSYPWIVKQDQDLRLYYVGWQAGGIGGFQTNIGLAQYSKVERKFIRVSKAPIVERINEEPICTGSLCIHKLQDHWVMWYTCFDRWEKQESGEYKHFYNIKVCTSEDGVIWQRPGKVAVDFSDIHNYVVAKPCVLIENGLYKMWYSYRGNAYCIGYAESIDGIKWERKDDDFRWSSPTLIFESEMQEYAHVFDVNAQRYMTYNGNGYGKSGVGLARMR